METQFVFVFIFFIFNIHIHIHTVNGGCYQFKLCCKSRNASCVSFETGSSYHNYYTVPNHVISTRLPRDWNPENFPGRKRSYPVDDHHVTNQNLENLDTNSNSTDSKNNSSSENTEDNFLDYSTTSQPTVQVPIRSDQSEQAKSENLILNSQSESIFEILNETEPLFQNTGPFQDNGPFQDSGPFQDESSGQYDDPVDYGSGDMQDVSFLGLNFIDGPTPNFDDNDSSVFDNKQYENAQYHVIDAVNDRSHKRRHTVDLMTDYTGKTKEISYMILGEKNHIVFDSIEKIGLLQPDKNVARLCYCDEQCGILNDCCSDYRETCPATDCIVSPWSSWGHCSRNHNGNNGHSKTNELESESGSESESECGPGISVRTRKILHESENGGAACPHLEEQKACYSADENTACGHLASEMALLLPYIYSDARQPGYKSSVYYDLPRDSDKSRDSENYCSIFVIHWYSSNCSFGFDNKVRVELNPGDKVCVECQSAAKRRNFYLTTGVNQNLRGNDQLSRCSGDGAKNIETLWSLVAAKNHQCFGQWTLIEKVANCQCDNYQNFPKFIFV